MGSSTCGARHSAITSQLSWSFNHQPQRLKAWHLNPITGWTTLLRPPITQTTRRGTGILTGCPSATPFSLTLGPTNPTRINLPSETLDLRGTRFSRVLRYSCQHSHFCLLQPSLRSTFTADRTLPYRPRASEDRSRPTASVVSLSPVKFSAQNH